MQGKNPIAQLFAEANPLDLGAAALPSKVEGKKHGRPRATVVREAAMLPAEAPARDLERGLVNNLIVNIRRNNPEFNRRKVKRLANKIARAAIRNAKKQAIEHKREIEKVRVLDQAEAVPEKPNAD